MFYGFLHSKNTYHDAFLKVVPCYIGNRFQDRDETVAFGLFLEDQIASSILLGKKRKAEAITSPLSSPGVPAKVQRTSLTKSAAGSEVGETSSQKSTAPADNVEQQVDAADSDSSSSD